MTQHLYYNWASGQTDRRQGHGYGKGQKIPSFGTGLGSETAMGSSTTGIYPEPVIAFEEEEEDLGDLDVYQFVRMINKDVRTADPAFWPRADRGSLGQSGNSSVVAALALTEKSLPIAKGQPLPGVMNTIAPFPHGVLYPGGFDGPPLGTGNAGQAFRTTGPFIRTGTQYGSARAPIDPEHGDDFDVLSFEDILGLDPSERSIIKQKIKIMKILNRLDEIDEHYSV